MKNTSQRTNRSSEAKFNPLPSHLLFSSTFHERKWFHTHGKTEHLSLNDKDMQKLRQYFNVLDQRNLQSIGPEDLQEPLIVFGMCENRDQVDHLVKIIDKDNSGVIEFDEFVDIFKVAKFQKKEKSGKQHKTGKDRFSKFASIISGDMGKQLSNQFGLHTSIGLYKRRMILDFIRKKNTESKMEGKRIVKQMALKMQRPDLLPLLNNYDRF